MLRALACCFLLTAWLPVFAHACVGSPSEEVRDKVLRELLNDADRVIVASVVRITRRRWTPDDEMGRVEKWWLQRQNDGLKILPDIQNQLHFSDSTAYLSAYLALKVSHIFEKAKDQSQIFRPPRKRVVIAIDLLRPFTVGNRGPCFNFPRTCPWDIKPGDYVAVAVIENPGFPWSAMYCVRTSKPSRKDFDDVSSRRGTSSSVDMLWPIIGAARAKIRTEQLRRRSQRN